MTAQATVVSCKVDSHNMNYITVVKMAWSGEERTVRFPTMKRVGERVVVKV